MKTEWNYPTSIRFGAGEISELPNVCKKLGIERPLLVTDPGIAKLDMIQLAIDQNSSQGLQTGLFSQTQPNPISKNVDDGVSFFRAGKFDGIIGWGGGSSIDTAKAIAFMAGQTSPIWHFEDKGNNWLRASTKEIPPIIAIPTTSGTGSEVGRASVITDETKRIKKVIFHPKMMPDFVLCDPVLVTGLPSSLTAFTGMDAIIHCFEAFCSPTYHPMADGIALEGLKLASVWLPKAFADGQDIEARGHMMSVALMGATAFQKGLGAIHSLSHPVSAIYNTHHGLTNAVFMPYVIKRNYPVIKDKLRTISAYLNLANKGYVGIIDWVLSLRENFKVPMSAFKLGVKPEDLDRLSVMAYEDPTIATNPLPIGISEIRNLYEDALNEFNQ